MLIYVHSSLETAHVLWMNIIIAKLSLSALMIHVKGLPAVPGTQRVLIKPMWVYQIFIECFNPAVTQTLAKDVGGNTLPCRCSLHCL